MAVSIPRLRSLALSLALALLLAFAAGVALAAALAGHARPLDTIGQFAGPALSVAIVGAALALVGARRRFALAFGAAAIVLAGEMLPQWFVAPQSPAEPGAKPVRVYVDNLWTTNRDGEAIQRSIKAADADVVALVQASDVNIAFVRRALAAYPYKLEPRPAFGWRGSRRTVVASRFPLTETQSSFDGWIQPGYGVDVAGPSPFRLVLIHLQRPWPYGGQDEQLAIIGRDLAAGGAAERTVLAGDFNATLSSAALQGFLRQTGLKPLPARLGDWPAYLPPPFRIGIENTMAGKGLSLANRRFGLANGSDHRPLIFDVAPARR